MRAFPLPQPNNFFFSQPDLNLSVLTSQYMSLLDQRALQPSSLLSKRPNPSFDSLLPHDTIQKKLKTTFISSPPQSSYPQISQITNLLFPGETQRFPDLLSLQRMQGLGSMLNLQSSKPQEQPKTAQAKNQGFHPVSKKVPTLEVAKPTFEKNMYLKEEYIHQQDLPTAHGSPLSVKQPSSVTHASDSESNEEKKDLTPIVDEPVLAELTKAFPEWDLSTTFAFLKSEKTMKDFEQERQAKLQKKRGRKPAQRKPKNVAVNQN